jgi:hypothetical protein
MVNWFCLACDKSKDSSHMHVKADNHQGICKKCHNQHFNMLNYKSHPNHHQQQQQQLQPIFASSSQHHSISLAQRYSIITLHLLQKYNNDDIARLVNCHEKTVKRWIHHFEAAEKFDDEAVSDLPRDGRPRCSSPSFDDDIVDFAKNIKFLTPTDIKNEFNSMMSTSTIKRRLYEAELHCRVARPEYSFTDEHIQKRLKFAEESSWQSMGDSRC